MSSSDTKSSPGKSSVPDTKSPPSVPTFWIEPSGGGNHPHKLTFLYNEDGVTKRRYLEWADDHDIDISQLFFSPISDWAHEMKYKVPQIRVEIEANYTGKSGAKQLEKELSPLKEHYPIVFSLWFPGMN